MGYVFTKTTTGAIITNQARYVEGLQSPVEVASYTPDSNSTIPPYIALYESGRFVVNINIDLIDEIDGNPPAGTMAGIVEQVMDLFPQGSSSGGGAAFYPIVADPGNTITNAALSGKSEDEVVVLYNGTSYYFDSFTIAGDTLTMTNGVTFGSADSVLLQISGSGGGGSSTLAGLSDVALSSPTNEQVLTYNTATSKWINADSTGGSSITIANVAFVEVGGDDTTGTVGNPAKPFATINAALLALPSSGGMLQVGIGDFDKPSTASWKSNVTIMGTQRPRANYVVKETSYDVFTTTYPTKLIEGTVIKGGLLINDCSGISVMNLGLDCGVDFVTGGGALLDCLVIASLTTTPPFTKNTDIVVDNVICLSNSPDTLIHAMDIENCYGVRITNCITIFGTHGIALKCEKAYLGHNTHISHASDCIVVRANDYATCSDVLIENPIGYTPNFVDGSGNPIIVTKGNGISLNVTDAGTGTTLNNITIVGGLFDNLTHGIEDSAATSTNPLIYVNIIGTRISNCQYGVFMHNTLYPMLNTLIVNSCSAAGIEISTRGGFSRAGKAKILGCNLISNNFGMLTDTTGLNDKVYLGNNIISNNSTGLNLNGSTETYGAANAIEDNSANIVNGTLNVWS